MVLRRERNSNRWEQFINALQEGAIIFKSPPALEGKYLAGSGGIEKRAII